MPVDPQHDTTALAPLPVRLKALGLSLREGRESRGVSLEELSSRLHMGMEQLRALEAGEASRLPELVFVIAQARRIAGFLELSIDPQIEALRQCAAPQAAAATESESAGPAMSFAADLLRLSAADEQEPLPLGERYERLERRLRENSEPDPVPVRTWWRPWMAKTLLLGTVSGGILFCLQWLRLPIAWPLIGSGAPAEPAKAPDSVEAGELLLRASGPSWLEVSNAAGQPIYYTILKGEKRFPIGAGLRVSAGRPDLIQVRTAAVPTRVLGRSDDLHWWLIQPDGRLKVLKTDPG